MIAPIALDPSTHPRACFRFAPEDARFTASYALVKYAGITFDTAYPTYLTEPQHVRVLHSTTHAALLECPTLALTALHLELCEYLGLPKAVPAPTTSSDPPLMPIFWEDQFDFGGAAGGQLLRNAAHDAIHHFTGIFAPRYYAKIETLAQVEFLAVAVDSYIQHRQDSSKPTSTLEVLKSHLSAWLVAHAARAGGCA